MSLYTRYTLVTSASQTSHKPLFNYDFIQDNGLTVLILYDLIYLVLNSLAVRPQYDVRYILFHIIHLIT